MSILAVTLINFILFNLNNCKNYALMIVLPLKDVNK